MFFLPVFLWNIYINFSGFEASVTSVDQSCPSSSALDAIQKMVSDSAQSASVSSAVSASFCTTRQETVNRQAQLSVAGNSNKGYSCLYMITCCSQLANVLLCFASRPLVGLL